MLLSTLAPERRTGASDVAHDGRSESDACWSAACQQFIGAVPESLRGGVERSLRNLHKGGSGLRAWVSAIAWRGGRIPATIPSELIQVYLNDPEAIPLHDCEKCGVAIPVRPDRLNGSEAEPEQVYFHDCPVCGGRTGWYMYFSRQAETTEAVRRKKPR